MKYILSRAFVEFGPFPGTELIDFHRRGLLRHGDFIRAEDTDDGWVPCDDWVGSHQPKSTAPAKAKKAPAAKKKTPAAKKTAAPKKRQSSAS